MVKLRRFGVVSSSHPDARAFDAACLRGLESAGCGRPAWIVEAGDPTAAAQSDSIDFILDLSRSRSHVAAARVPLFGVWSFDVDGGDPPGWRAMIAGAPSLRARLCADLGDGSRVVLQEGSLPVSLNYPRTREQLHHILAGWPGRAAAEIETGDWSAMTRDATPEHARDPDPLPSPAERVQWMLVAPWRRLWHWWCETARYDTWNVGIATLAQPLQDVRQLDALGAIRWLPPRRPLYFLADPFPYHHNGRDSLLVEEYGHPKGVRGHISRVDVTADTVAVEPVIVRDSHLSYPFTFEDDGRACCAAEMGQEDGCIIYQLGNDGAWAPRHHILRGHKIVDPTFVRIENRWWLFCTDSQGAGSLVLHAFYADDIDGPWTPHRLNPLKCDLSSARPAGRPLTIAGRLFRPAQDCSQTYGGAVNLMEVVELSPTRFREVRALRLEPDPDGPYPHGLHHLVVDGRRVYLDAKRRRYDYLLWLKVWLPWVAA
jgi:hypothetical protein